MLKSVSFQKFWTHAASCSLTIFFLIQAIICKNCDTQLLIMLILSSPPPSPPRSQCLRLWSVWGTLRPNSLYHLQHWLRGGGNEIEFYCSLNNFWRRLSLLFHFSKVEKTFSKTFSRAVYFFCQNCTFWQFFIGNCPIIFSFKTVELAAFSFKSDKFTNFSFETLSLLLFHLKLSNLLNFFNIKALVNWMLTVMLTEALFHSKVL